MFDNALPVAARLVGAVLSCSHFDAIMVVAAQTIAVQTEMDWYFGRLCIVAIAAQSAVGRIECRDFHWAEWQTALAKFGRSCLAGVAALVAATFH